MGKSRTSLAPVLSRREQKLLRTLRERRARDPEGRFLAEGVRVVEDLLASPLAVSLLLAASSLEDSERGRALLATAARRGIPRYTLPDAEFAGYAATRHPQGVLAVAAAPRRTLGDVTFTAGRRAVLVLDAVQDPGNFGTLVRTAEALGAAGVILLPGTVDPWNAKAVRAAVGASFRVPLVAATWSELAPWLAREQARVLVADAAGASVAAADAAGRSALVVGNEGAGVGEESRAHADALVAVPIRGRAESLNVAAAAAILLYELLR
jgi:TrmH family RNA methyltransferase